MEVDKIITLNENDKFLLLSSVDYENNKYFLAAGLKPNKDIDLHKLVILKQEADNNVSFVQNQDLIAKLTKPLRDAIK